MESKTFSGFFILSHKTRESFLGVNSDMKLRKQFAKTEKYLNYHRDNVFLS